MKGYQKKLHMVKRQKQMFLNTQLNFCTLLNYTRDYLYKQNDFKQHGLILHNLSRNSMHKLFEIMSTKRMIKQIMDKLYIISEKQQMVECVLSNPLKAYL